MELTRGPVELTRGYELADIWNMDETGCFLRRCQRKVSLKRKVKPEEEKSKKRGFQLMFLPQMFVSADVSFRLSSDKLYMQALQEIKFRKLWFGAIELIYRTSLWDIVLKT